MKPPIVMCTNERIVPATGLTVVGSLLNAIHFCQACNSWKAPSNHPTFEILNGDVLSTEIGLICMGDPSFSSIAQMYEDPEFYKMALGIITIPSEETLRQRMDLIGETYRPLLLVKNVELLQNRPTPMANGFVPVDIDVTPFDNSNTSKEGVSYTYKGFCGYSPIIAYIGTEGFMLNNEFRIGKQNCQNHTPEFLTESIMMARQITNDPLMVRLDSGNDAAVNIGVLTEMGCSYIIKRNLRKEGKETWLDFAKANLPPEDETEEGKANLPPEDETEEGKTKEDKPRKGKTVYTGSTYRSVEYWGTDETTGTSEPVTTTVRIVYEVIVRTIAANGQILLGEDLEVNTWWTNLPCKDSDGVGFSDKDIVALYHAHGECEQYHSELKSDMDLERLPSGKFATNALILELAMIAFNILRIMGQASLEAKNERHPVNRRRIRTVIANLIMIASHVTRHARRIILGLGCSNVWRRPFMYVYNKFVPATI